MNNQENIKPSITAHILLCSKLTYNGNRDEQTNNKHEVKNSIILVQLLCDIIYMDSILLN